MTRRTRKAGKKHLQYDPTSCFSCANYDDAKTHSSHLKSSSKIMLVLSLVLLALNSLPVTIAFSTGFSTNPASISSSSFANVRFANDSRQSQLMKKSNQLRVKNNLSMGLFSNNGHKRGLGLSNPTPIRRSKNHIFSSVSAIPFLFTLFVSNFSRTNFVRMQV